MVNFDALIHDKKYFRVDYIDDRKKQYNFTQAVKVETFLWDLEIFAQLQNRLGKKVILKGGAAAQLFFPPERQRTSVDIDVIYVGDGRTLSDTLASIHNDFGNDDLYFSFAKYVPKNPKTQLPLITYFVPVPMVTGARRPTNIKIDFHLMDDVDLSIIELQKATAFVVPLAFAPRCLSPGALIGDKLLTFARGSVGIPPEREDDIPKQLYDVDGLTKVVDVQEFWTVEAAMEELFALELSVRPEKVTLETALEQMVALLEKYSNLDSPKSDDRARTAIQNFRGNYEPRPFNNPIGWEILSKRLQFLVKCISAGTVNPLLLLKTVDQMEILMRMVEERFKETRMVVRQQLRDQFVSDPALAGPSGTAKRLKNTPLERILWEIVTPTNVEEIKRRISAVRQDL